jgi:hypothetical protein
MASPTLAMDPSDVARRVVEYNLRVVWRGSQRVNLSVCTYVIVKCGGIVGGGGTIKQFLLMFLLLCLITYNKKMFSLQLCVFFTTLKFYISYGQVTDQLQTLQINFYEKPNTIYNSFVQTLEYVGTSV